MDGNMFARGTLFIWSICCLGQLLLLVDANVLFQFSLNFHVKQRENETQPINATITVDNNHLFVQDNNENRSWTEAEELHKELGLQQLAETKSALQNLNVELTPLVGRSDDLAGKLKQSLRYVNELDAAVESGDFGQQMEQLRRFVTLVDSLSAPSKAGGVRTLEYVLLKLAMEKYNLQRLQQQVAEQLRQSEAAWTRYKSTQVVLLEN